jgi:CRP/FNR family transcriptional regulator, cyclic AMP receptor protein
MAVCAKMEFEALLAAAPFFDRLPPEQRASLFAAMELKAFAAGEAIFARGDPARALYVVVSGSVRLSVLSEDGGELTLLHAGIGAMFGEIGCFDGGDRTTDATALGATQALALQRRDLTSEMQRHPEIALAAMTFLGERLRATNDRLEAIALYSVEARLARFLLAQVRAAAKAAERKPWLHLDMSQTDISLIIAASRPKVSAAFAALEDKGAIHRDGKTVGCDLERLARLACVEI